MMHRIQKLPLLKIVLITAIASLASMTNAQVRPVNDYGALGLGQMLRRTQTTARVMMIGAHPDDEDSALLAYLARGENARTAYLSLTRGDGGQNIIGPELFEALGIIRTEELLQARRLDGGEQYFTRAYDYGFSKTLDEAKQKWPEDVIKCDMVRVIRQFKPQVVISLWSGTPGDGHGQHQYSGYISPIAVKAAGDAAQCKDTGPAWQVLKFYVERGGGGSEPSLRINTGKYDPLLGRSYFEIAMEGRSQHRSQGEGRIEYRGDQFSTLRLVDSKVERNASPETSVFDGINTARRFALDDGVITMARSDLISRLLPMLSGPGIGDPTESFLEVTSLIRAAAGLQIDALADRETVTAGEAMNVAVRVYLHALRDARVKEVEWLAPTGWQVRSATTTSEPSSAFARRENGDFAGSYTVTIPSDAKPTQPYWMENDRVGDMFQWPKDPRQDLPFDPPTLTARVKLSVGATELVLDQPVQYRFAEPARGELRREFNVVPRVSVSVDKDVIIAPINSSKTRQINVTVTNNSSGSVSGTVELVSEAFRGPSATSPRSATFDLKSKGASQVMSFDVDLSSGGSRAGVPIRAVATIGNGRYDRKINVIAYPHIQTHRFYTPAVTNVVRVDLKAAPVNVGYIMGSGDEVPDAIRQMGLNVTMIDDIAASDLSKFDTVVVGIRASEVRPDFAANNQKLLEYVKNGGNLIVQYQRPTFAQQNLAPFPVGMADNQRTAAGSTSRVVDENAKVTILDPAHPIFNFPNKVTDADFNSWIQERNLYNFVTFDKAFTPLLESHDAGEQPNSGGLVVANIGKGTYVYTSYSWFRQLPAGVPGAYRLFANLLSLSKATVKN